MAPKTANPNESPATLVAIIVAARRARDRDLERIMRRELEHRYGVRLTFAAAPQEGHRDE